MENRRYCRVLSHNQKNKFHKSSITDFVELQGIKQDILAEELGISHQSVSDIFQ